MEDNPLFIHESELTGEKVHVYRGYSIGREVDSKTPELEKELEKLKNKFKFEYAIENYPV